MNEFDKLSGIVFIKIAEQPTELKYPTDSLFFERTEVGQKLAKQILEKQRKPKKIKYDKYRIEISGFNLLKKEIQMRIINKLRKQMEG